MDLILDFVPLFKLVKLSIQSFDNVLIMKIYIPTYVYYTYCCHGLIVNRLLSNANVNKFKTLLFFILDTYYSILEERNEF